MINPGDKFGEFTILRAIPHSKGTTNHSFVATCSCGKETIVYRSNLKKLNHCKACAGRLRIKHGMTNNSTYRSWSAMKQRCTNQNQIQYSRYGAKGITFDERWKEFKNFLTDMGERPSDQHILVRINVDGDFTPDNCRWTTKAEEHKRRMFMMSKRRLEKRQQNEQLSAHRSS